MRQGKPFFPGCLCLCCTLLISCGGGGTAAGGSGSGGSNGSGTPPPSTLSCAPASQTVMVSAAVNLSASGGNGSYSWSAPNGTPASATGQTFSTAYGAAGADTITVTSGSQSANCSVTVNAPPPPFSIGGGKTSYVLDPAMPAALASYLKDLLPDLVDSGVLSDVGGSASGNDTITITYSPGNNDCCTGGTIHLGELPSPGPNGVDRSLDEIASTEMCNSLRARVYDLEAAVGHDIIYAADDEGWAAACADAVLRELTLRGIRSEYVNLHPEVSSLVDTVGGYKSATIATGIRDRYPYNFGMIESGEGVYRMLVGPDGVLPLADYEKKYFDEMNAQGRLLSKDERQAFLDSVAQIDGDGAGHWISVHLPDFLQLPAPQAGTYAIALPVPEPQWADGVIVQSWTISTSGSRSPVAGGAVAVSVTDRKGNRVLPEIDTDLASTASPEKPLSLQLENKLPAGAYLVSAAVNGGAQTAQFVAVVVPFACADSLSADTTGSPRIFAYATDASGNLAGGDLAVTDGTVISGCTADGVAVVKPMAGKGVVVINGKTITVSATRTVAVPQT